MIRRGVLLMLSSKDKGNFGENEALKFLVKNGYTILERNFRTRYGEIDIIGRDSDYISFIEVKARKDIGFGLPCQAVDIRKQYRIARMALLYIAIKNLKKEDFRFDVVELIYDSEYVKYIRIIKDAFQIDCTL
jgi:putative endonuclease